MKRTLIILAATVLAACSETPGDAFRISGDYGTAAQMYYKLASQGDAGAAFKLGLLISRKQLPAHEAHSYGPASVWFEKSCPAEPAGCHNLGVEYTNAGNHQKAEQYYFQAANLNYMQSQFNLASAYVNGYLPLPADPVGIFSWLLIARSESERCRGIEPSLCRWILADQAGNQAWFRSRLSPAQQAEAEGIAKSWAATH